MTIKQAQADMDRCKKEQEIYYSVMINGNRHNLPYRFKMTKETITVAKCKKFIATVEGRCDIKIDNLKILMQEFDYTGITADTYLGILCGDGGLTCKVDKEASYNPATKCLRIWEDGYPVYENDDGVITRDRDALADCLM